MTKVQDVSNYWLQQHNMLVAAAAIFLCLKIFKFYIFSSSWKKTWGKDFSMFMLLLCQTDALWRTKYFHQTSQRITNIKHFKFGGMVLIFWWRTYKQGKSQREGSWWMYLCIRALRMMRRAVYGDICTQRKAYFCIFYVFWTYFENEEEWPPCKDFPSGWNKMKII